MNDMADATRIKLIVSDVDGVWTDGKIIYLGENRELKEFNVRDGLAVKLAQRAGIAVALLTSRHSPALARRARELGIEELHQNAANKLAQLQKIATRLSLRIDDQILYAGDDLPDLAPMRSAAISAAPADAAPEVLRAASWKLETRGGGGAFRELVERLLRERGEWDAVVAHFTSGNAGAKSL